MQEEEKPPFTFFTLTGDCYPGDKLTIERHVVTQEDLDDYGDVDETPYYTAKRIIYENVVMEAEQQFTPCLVINEEQLLSLANPEISNE